MTVTVQVPKLSHSLISTFWMILSLSLALHLTTLSPCYADPTILRIGGAGGFKLPDKNAVDPKSRADRAIVDAFEAENPDIRLQSAQGLQIDGPAAESSLLLSFAGGSAPDVVYVNFRSSATYIGQGFLAPLDGYLSQDKSVMNRLKPEIRKVLLDVGHGHIYSIPYAQYVQALYYRKDLFSAAGLDPDRPPGTWDEFYTDAQKITQQDRGMWGFEFGTDPDASAYWWVNFLWQAGGDVIKKNAHGQWEAAFNSDAGASALEFYNRLMSGPWTGPNGVVYHGVADHSATMSKDRADGKVGMWFQYQSNVIANTADATTLNPSLVGIAPMPKGPTGITANELNAAMWGISSQITDPKVREAAWRFVKFMSSDDADRIRTQAYVEAGLGNTVNPEDLQKYGYGDYTTRASAAWLAANKTLFLHGHPEPYAENMNQIYILLGVPLSRIETNPNADPKVLLSDAAREVNTKLTNYVQPQLLQSRRRWAWSIFTLLMGVIFTAGVAAIRRVMIQRSSIKSGQGQPSGQSQSTNRSQLLAWIFMFPAVASVVVWAYYPLCRGLVMAFEDYRILGHSRYVGLDNFIDVFHQPTFWKGLENSFLFTIYNLVFGFFLPIALALGISMIPRGQIVFRTLYYLPAVTAGLAIAFMWKIFESSTPDGLFNSWIHFISGGRSHGIKWLDDPKWAMIAVVLPGIWASAGPGSLIYQAALKSIPEEMYEAADIDGASIWTKIVRITLPTLKPLIIINFVGVTIGTFKAMETIFVMTGGGPQYATHTLGMEVYYNAFLFLKFGYATAAAWIMGALLIGFTLYQLRMMRNLRFSAARA